MAAFQHAVDITLLAQEILVDRAGYPTSAIARNSGDFRPLGLGYANLGALIMSRGLPYDSPEGRNFAAALTALMHGRAKPCRPGWPPARVPSGDSRPTAPPCSR